MEEEAGGEGEGESRRVLVQLQRIERWAATLDSAACQDQGQHLVEELGSSLLAAVECSGVGHDVGAQATRVAALVHDLHQASLEYMQAFCDFDADLLSADVFDAKLDRQNRVHSLLRSELAVLSENMTQAIQRPEEVQGDAVRCAQSSHVLCAWEAVDYHAWNSAKRMKQTKGSRDHQETERARRARARASERRRSSCKTECGFPRLRSLRRGLVVTCWEYAAGSSRWLAGDRGHAQTKKSYGGFESVPLLASCSWKPCTRASRYSTHASRMWDVCAHVCRTHCAWRRRRPPARAGVHCGHVPPGRLAAGGIAAGAFLSATAMPIPVAGRNAHSCRDRNGKQRQERTFLPAPFSTCACRGAPPAPVRGVGCAD